MKKLILLAAIALGVVVSATAQENKPEGYKFTDKKVVKTVPITNQYRSGASLLSHSLRRRFWQQVASR